MLKRPTWSGPVTKLGFGVLYFDTFSGSGFRYVPIIATTDALQVYTFFQGLLQSRACYIPVKQGMESIMKVTST